jgi:hypothetical protein
MLATNQAFRQYHRRLNLLGLNEFARSGRLHCLCGIRFVFMSPWIEVVLVAEIAVAVLVRFLVRPALILRGMHYDRDQAQAVSPALIGAPNSWVR